MATAKQRRAYVSRINRAFRQQDRLTDDTIRSILSMLVELRKDIAPIVLEAGDFQAANLQRIIAQIETAVNAFESHLTDTTLTAIRNAYELGENAVTEPLIAAGVQLPLLTLGSQRIAILEAFGADLVKDVSDEIKRRIAAQVRLAAIGAGQPLNIMREITGILGVINQRKMIVKGVAARAEKIYRTELNRVFSMGNYDKQVSLSQSIPGLQKQWMATGDLRTRKSHLDAHGQIVPVNELFRVGGEDMMFPHDPGASAKNVVQCRCRSVTVHPDIGPMITAEDARIDKERARRER